MHPVPSSLAQDVLCLFHVGSGWFLPTSLPWLSMSLAYSTSIPVFLLPPSSISTVSSAFCTPAQCFLRLLVTRTVFLPYASYTLAYSILSCLSPTVSVCFQPPHDCSSCVLDIGSMPFLSSQCSSSLLSGFSSYIIINPSSSVSVFLPQCPSFPLQCPPCLLRYGPDF